MENFCPIFDFFLYREPRSHRSIDSPVSNMQSCCDPPTTRTFFVLSLLDFRFQVFAAGFGI